MTKLLVSLCLALALPSVGHALPDALVAAACETAKQVDACPTCTCAVTSVTPAAGKALGVVLRVAGAREGGGEAASLHIALGDATKLMYEAMAGKSQVSGNVATDDTLVARGQVAVGDHGVVHTFDATATIRVRAARDEVRAETYTFATLCWQAPEPVCWSVQLGHETRVETGPTKVVSARASWLRPWRLTGAGEVELDAPTGDDVASAYPAGALRVKLGALASVPYATRLWVKVP